METERYSIKLDREGGMHPEDIPAGKLAELLSVLSRQFADKTEDFCLAAIADNCIRLDFQIRSEPVKAAVAAFSALIAGISVASDPATLRNLAEFDRVRAKLSGVSMTFPAVDGCPSVTLHPERKLSEMVKEKPNVRFQHTIYGKVIDAGGDKPNIHIRPLGGGEVIICDCSEELASEVAHHLYSIVGIQGEVTKNEDSFRMKATALLPYRKPKRNPFAILKESGVGKYFENENVDDFMREVRGGQEDCNV